MGAQRWRVATLVVALATGAGLGFTPSVATSSCSTTSTGISSCTSGHESLVASEGTEIVLVLMVPALIAVIPVIGRGNRSTIAAAALLTIATVLGLASIGIFFIPTVALAWTAAATSRRVSIRQTGHLPAT